MRVGGMSLAQRDDDAREANELMEAEQYLVAGYGGQWPNAALQFGWERPSVCRLNYDLNWLPFGDNLPWAHDGRDKDWSQWNGEVEWHHSSGYWSERLRVYPDGERWRWSYTYAIGYDRLRFVEGASTDKEACQHAAIDERNVWQEHLADVEAQFGPHLLRRRLIELHRNGR